MIAKEMALQFALILSAGVPQIDSMKYMCPQMEAQDLKLELGLWLADENVQAAILKIQGSPWEKMSLEDKIKFAIDKHYTEMAYFLYAHNYAELAGPDRSKADTCRQVLEAKIAGMSGKMDSLTTFWADVTSGRVPLNQPTSTIPNGVSNAHPLKLSAN